MAIQEPADSSMLENTITPTDAGLTYEDTCNISNIKVEDYHKQDEETYNQYIHTKQYMTIDMKKKSPRKT